MVLAAPKFREKFTNVEYLIIDEIHEICDAKRGAHLSLTLERRATHLQLQIVLC